MSTDLLNVKARNIDVHIGVVRISCMHVSCPSEACSGASSSRPACRAQLRLIEALTLLDAIFLLMMCHFYFLSVIRPARFDLKS